MLPIAPAKIRDTAMTSVLEASFRMLSNNQYPIPVIAKRRNMVSTNFPALSDIGNISLSFVPHAAPSFSINKILNQLKTSTDSPSIKMCFDIDLTDLIYQ